jgi:hypothetical protein
MWRHRAVWYVGSDVLSRSTEQNPHNVSRMFRDASKNYTRTAGVTTLRKNGIDKLCLQAAAHITKRTEVCSYPIFCGLFRAVTKNRWNEDLHCAGPLLAMLGQWL